MFMMYGIITTIIQGQRARATKQSKKRRCPQGARNALTLLCTKRPGLK